MVARLVLTNYTKTHCMCSQGGTFLQHRATGGQAVDCGIQSNKKNTQKWIDINKAIIVKTGRLVCHVKTLQKALTGKCIGNLGELDTASNFFLGKVF